MPNLEKLYIEGTKINNLELGELTNLTYLEIWDPYIHTSVEELYINIDLSKMDNLSHFSYNVNFPEGTTNADEKAEQIKSYITAPHKYDIYTHVEEATQTGECAVYYSLIEKLNIELLTFSTGTYEVGEEVVVMVEWDKPLQATEYVLQFDSTTLEFVTASVEEDFYDTTYISDGEIGVSWVSLYESDITSMQFRFNAIAESNQDSIFRVIIQDFATGELDTKFTVYGNTEKAITIIPTDYIKNNAPIQVNNINVDGEDYNIISGITLNDNKLNLDYSNWFDDGVEVVGDGQSIGTGYILELFVGDKNVRTLWVLVYGDVDCDGEITAADALTLIKAKNNKLPDTTLPWYSLEAGKVFSDHDWSGGPTAVDALAIIKHLNGKYEISQNY